MKMERTPDWLDPYPWLDVSSKATDRQVRGALAHETPGLREFSILLSKAAGRQIELMAQKALALTRKHFGRTIALYVPLYLSNYCSSGCVYCGFASDRRRRRMRLDSAAMAAEMKVLRKMGFEEILLLTGERTPQADFNYLHDAVALAAKMFQLVTIESFPMTADEYSRLVRAGCSGMTIYQETYEPEIYAKAHRWGPKKDFLHRLETPARALAAGMRFVGLGALLGLADPVLEAIALFQHAGELTRVYWQGGISISFPRVRPQEGAFQPPHPVNDAFLAQMIFAFRICMPEIHLVLSTRERSSFRDHLAGVGISKMSIASRTTVGGYHAENLSGAGQFEVADGRGLDEFRNVLKAKGLLPVFKNWDTTFREEKSGDL